ncbi:MAG: hypothetical protein JW801_08935 [Bacteroidales bacterium]|nr:hypothetical protein [Bacteroidales bacterium]
MIKFLRNNQQIFIFLIFLYGVLAVFIAYFAKYPQTYYNSPFEMPLLLDIYLNTSGKGTMVVLALLVYLGLIITGFFLVRLGINYQIVSQRSQFAALFLIALSSFCFGRELFSGAGVAAIFLLFSLERVVGSIDQKGLSYRFLDAGILLACGSFFYLNMIFLLPFLWLAQLILRPVSWRELVFTLMGILLPAVFYFSGAFILGKPIDKIFIRLEEWIFLKKVIEVNSYLLSGIISYLFMMIVGSIFALRKFAAAKIQSRKLHQLLLLLFINILGVMLIIPSAGLEIFFLLAIPSSILLSIYFTECRNNFINRLILFILLLIPLFINLLA